MKAKSKSILLITLLLIAVFCCSAQSHTTKELLYKIDNAVNSIGSGRFILHNSYYKVSVGEDSTDQHSTFNCFFQKCPSDTLTGFKLASFRNDGYKQIYNGTTLMTLTPWNKTVETIEKVKYPEKIRDLNKIQSVYPFFKYVNTQLQYYNSDTTLKNIAIIGVETFKGENCYRLQTGISHTDDKLKTESYIFVSTSSLLPIGQNVRFEASIGQAKEIQVFNYWMSDLKPSAIADDQFSKAALQEYSKEKQFNPSDDESKSQLLPLEKQAPDWQLPLLSGSTIKLSDLKGRIVILDFWYKACAPCQKQMIALQKLQEKFVKDSVTFIGVNTIDDPVKDRLELFLRNRNITVTTVYNGKAIERTYGVYASPALFVIDKEGKIVFTVDGYSDTLLDDVSAVIRKRL